MKNLFLPALTVILAFTFSCKKDTKDNQPSDPVEIESAILVQNLQYPWEILWGADDFIWMTERGGKISRVNPTTKAVTPVITIGDVNSQGEGGLLGMVLHPNFTATPQVFVAYNYTDGGNYYEKIVRYTYNGTTLTSPLILIDSIRASNIHNGCRLLINDSKLYITTGDASNTGLPQNNASANGKILRLNLDGSVPADNPIAGNPLWSSGHRNPQGLVFANNILYSSEHGPNNDDEINIIEKGRNYGWPDVQGFCNTTGEQTVCSAKNVKEPIQAWTPTIAVSGMEFYDKDSIPQWKNSLLVATLKNTRLMQLKLDAAHTTITEVNEFFNGQYGRMRDVCISPNGTVYICTSNGSNDKIVVVTKKQS